MPRPLWPSAHVVAPLLARMLVAALVTAPLLIATTATPAAAHDQLLETDPADGSTVEQVPAEVVMRFSGDLIDLSQAVIVTTPDGEQLTDLVVTVSGATATAALPDGLGPGAYTVAWRVVSEDGHPVEGVFGFTVAGPAPSATPAPTTPAASTPAPTTTGPVSPSPGVTPTPTASPGTDGSSDDDAPGSPARGWAVAAVLAAVAALGAAGVVILRRRRP
jgi:methionine-rich copper-binding protein CopC